VEAFVGLGQLFCHGGHLNWQRVVSAGARGAYAQNCERWNYSPAPNLAVASTAGAGDALLGGLIAAIAAGIPLLKPRTSAQSLPGNQLDTALGLGVLLASYKCLSPHTIHPTASLATVVEFAKNLDFTFGPGLEQFFS